MITIFKNYNSTDAPFYRDIGKILDRIKIGTSKDVIEKVRSETEKKKQDKIKGTLPAICFSGTFKNRTDKAIIEHSGYICIDFDKYNNLDEVLEQKKKLSTDAYIYSVFISPGGLGLKAIVKIPKEIENHKKYFAELNKYFNTPHFDLQCSNLSRICYESYDSDIYINENSLLFSPILEDEKLNYITSIPKVKLINEDEIIRRLVKWFENKYTMASGSRNANLFILASAFSDYGVSQIDAVRFCNYNYKQTDFTENEIERTIQSAYSKCAGNFGMNYFEDIEGLKAVKREIKNGKSFNEVKNILPQIEEKQFNELKDITTATDFWTISKKGGIIINNYDYINWLQANGFYKYYPTGADNFVFVRVTNNLIDDTTEVKIKDFVMSELLKIGEHKVYEYFANNSKYFKDDYLNLLNNVAILFKEDIITEGYIYFRNGAVKVTADKIKLIDYIDLNGFVWKKHIIDFDYVPSANFENDFEKFIYLVSAKDADREKALKTTIGYLMHSFKTSANNKAIILNDETISENPNGGSGKGIFWNAIGKVKRCTDINGKSFSFEKSFSYQTVSADTQLLVFDDVQKNFKFENLFSIITEGITLEKKNKDAIKLPIYKSPKILITTNYTIGGVGGSFERRKWELEFSSYFSDKHTPLNEFGRMLFDEWDSNEWNKFYNYMLNCLQLYLKYGLTSNKFQNLDIRKFIKETSHEFYEWSNDENSIDIDKRLYKIELFETFLKEYPDFKKWLSNKRFWQWMRSFAIKNNYGVIEGKDLTGRYVTLTKNTLKDFDDAPF